MKEMTTSVKKIIRQEYKRAMAFILTFMMLFTNVGSNVSIALAANAIPTITATFKLRGEDIREAAQEAIEGGEVFDPAFLELSTKDATLMSKYERLLGDGVVYEIYPDMDDEAAVAGTELRTFLRMEEEAADAQLTGEEEIIFLFINTLEQRVQFYADVDGYVTGGIFVDGHQVAVQTPSNVAPEETLPEEATEAVVEETTEAAPEESVEAIETSETIEETEPVETEAVETEPIESEVVETEPETEAEVEVEEDAVDAVDGELTVGISRNQVAIVTTPEGEATIEEATEEAVVDTSVEVLETEQESVEAETVPETTASSETDEDDYFISEDKEYYDGIELVDDVTPEDELLEEESRGGNIKGTTYNQIELGEDAYARAFKTTLNALHVDARVEGYYSVRYVIDPLGGADIINKETSVEEGSRLSFGVRPQGGYEIEEVTANGISLEAVDNASESNLDSVTSYEIESMEEDLEIRVVLIETDEHPEFHDEVTINGVTIRASAAEGILPEGTELSVKEVTQQVEVAVKEKVESEADDVIVETVMAYDINLMHNGKRLDNSWSVGNDNYVVIQFSGKQIEETSKGAETAQVLYVDTEKEETLSAENADGVTAEELVVETKETVSVKAGTGVDELAFRADHFTIYAYVTTGRAAIPLRELDDDITLNVGDVIYVYSDATGNTWGSWKSSNTGAIEVKAAGTVLVNGENRPQAKLTASKEGKATVTYMYYDLSGQKKDSAKITVGAEGTHKITWFTNGQSKTTYVADGRQPTYGGTPERSNSGNMIVEFAGWATSPNSKQYVSADELPKATADASYYAVFTNKTHFYFVLEGKSNTSPLAEDYMYAGEGLVIIPDEFKVGSSRWYNTRYSIDDFIVNYPTDAAIREGIKKAYPNQYNQNWDYNIDWTTLSSASPSVGYDYTNISWNSTMHVDGMLTIDKTVTAGINYIISQPDSNTSAHSKTHMKGTIFALNSTVKDTGEFWTDGESYNAIINYEGKPYQFDGWYMDSSFTTKAPNEYKVTGVATFYARYVAANTYTVSYNWGEEAPSTAKLPDGIINLMSGATYTVSSRYHQGSQIDNKNEHNETIGYWTFSGWKLDGKVVTGQQTIGDSSVELQGMWTYTDLFTVTYKTGAQGAFQESIHRGLREGDPTPVFDGDTDPKTGEPKGNIGYQFTGWDPTPNKTVEATAEYIAQWQEKNSYMVKYDMNGGTTLASIEDKTNVSWTATNLLPEAEIAKNDAWSLFAGWKVLDSKGEATGEFVTPEDSYAKLAKDDTVGFITLQAQWEDGGKFKVYEYFPESGLTEYGRYLETYEAKLPDQSELRYNQDNQLRDLTIENINTILLASKEQTQKDYPGVKLTSVYIDYEKIVNGKKDWQRSVTAVLGENNQVVSFDGLNELRINAECETRLTFGYELPVTVDVEYWKMGTSAYVEVENSGYTLGTSPNFIYQYDTIAISDRENEEPTILKVVPEGVAGYEVDKVVALSGDEEPTGNESGIKTSYTVNSRDARVAVLLKGSANSYTVEYHRAEKDEQGNITPTSKLVKPLKTFTEGVYTGNNIKVEAPEIIGYSKVDTATYKPTVYLPIKADPEKNVVIFYYVVDVEKEFNFTVIHEYPGEDNDRSEPASVNAGTELRATPDNKPGYKLMSQSYAPYGAGSFDITAAFIGEMRGEDITVTYTYEVDESQTFDYTVNYYIKDTTNLVPGIDPNPVTGEGYVGKAITISYPAVTTGYKASADQPTNLTVTNDAASNVKTVYYEIDKEQTFDFIVEHVYSDGTIIREDAVQKNVEDLLGSSPNAKDGYKLELWSVTPEKAGTFEDDATFNGIMQADTVTVTYKYEKRSDLQYTINYIYEDRTGATADQTTSTTEDAVFETEMQYDDTKTKEHTIAGETKTYTLDQIVFANPDVKTQNMVTTDPEKNVVTLHYALDILNEENPKEDTPDTIPDKYQIVFAYESAEHGTVNGTLREVLTREKDGDVFSATNPAYPRATGVEAIPDEGYRITKWISDNPGVKERPILRDLTTAEYADVAEIRNTAFAADTTFTAHFHAGDETRYSVEVYYQDKGTYPSKPAKSVPVSGTTDTQITIDPATYADAVGYVFDATAGNVLEGIVAGNNSLVLKVYFKQQFTVTYKPGDRGSFAEEVYSGLDYNAATPAFGGSTTANGSYRFDGWDQGIVDQVTGDAVYTAQWRYTGGGGGTTGGGGGGGPRPNTPSTEGGPGDNNGPVTILPNEVPLAMAPDTGATADDLILIDDGEVPLAALPKTGNPMEASGLMLLISGMMLAAFATLSRKKEEE